MDFNFCIAQRLRAFVRAEAIRGVYLHRGSDERLEPRVEREPKVRRNVGDAGQIKKSCGSSESRAKNKKRSLKGSSSFVE